MTEKEYKPKAVPILEKTTTGTNVLRGRDVVATLGNRNLDPLLIDILAKVAENAHTTMKGLAEVATMQDQLINVVQKFSDIAGNMKDKMASLERGISGVVEGEEGDNSVN